MTKPFLPKDLIFPPLHPLMCLDKLRLTEGISPNGRWQLHSHDGPHSPSVSLFLSGSLIGNLCTMDYKQGSYELTSHTQGGMREAGISNGRVFCRVSDATAHTKKLHTLKWWSLAFDPSSVDSATVKWTLSQRRMLDERDGPLFVIALWKRIKQSAMRAHRIREKGGTAKLARLVSARKEFRLLCKLYPACSELHSTPFADGFCDELEGILRTILPPQFHDDITHCHRFPQIVESAHVDISCRYDLATGVLGDECAVSFSTDFKSMRGSNRVGPFVRSVLGSVPVEFFMDTSGTTHTFQVPVSFLPNEWASEYTDFVRNAYEDLTLYADCFRELIPPFYSFVKEFHDRGYDDAYLAPLAH